MRMRTALEKGDLSEVVAIYQRVQVDITQNIFCASFPYPFANQVGEPLSFCLLFLLLVSSLSLLNSFLLPSFTCLGCTHFLFFAAHHAQDQRSR